MCAMIRTMRAGEVRNDRFFAIGFASIVVGSVIFDATHAWFWQRAHETAPVAALLVFALVAALLRRHRFAWWIFLIVGATSLPPWVAHGLTKHVNVGFVVGLLLGFLELVILLSVPMRRYMGVGRWSRAGHVGPART